MRFKDNDTVNYVAKAATMPRQQIAYVLCAALEGGSTYWCGQCTVVTYPGETEWAHEAIAAGTDFSVRDFEAEETTVVKNSDEKLGEAMSLMADHYPGHWKDFVNENEDAITGDIFFQLLCFGEVVYG